MGKHTDDLQNCPIAAVRRDCIMTRFSMWTKAATSLFWRTVRKRKDASALHVAKFGSCRTTNRAREGQGGPRSIGGGRVSRKRKLSCLAAGLRLKVRKRYANESNAFGCWECRSDKAESQLM